MNEIGEEKVKVQVRVRWSHGNGTLLLPSAVGSRPATILAVFDLSNSIESHHSVLTTRSMRCRQNQVLRLLHSFT
jgi:hypothetical protein